MIEPLSVALHAVRRAGVCLGDTSLVVGAGMIGLLVVQCLRAAGCGRIIAVDLNRGRLDLACRLGADEGLLSESQVDEIPGEVRRALLAARRSGLRGRFHLMLSRANGGSLLRKGGQTCAGGQPGGESRSSPCRPW